MKLAGRNFLTPAQGLVMGCMLGEIERVITVIKYKGKGRF